MDHKDEPLEISEEEWKNHLSKEQYHVLREKGTEPPFTGKYYRFDKEGIYHCGACDYPLFRSNAKFDSGCGWPSFFEPITEESIRYHHDKSHNMDRIEIVCPRCGSHLGHVFDDGPQPTGKRYCVNSLSLEFREGDLQ